MSGPPVYPSEPEARAIVERYEAELAAIAVDAIPLLSGGAQLAARLTTAIAALRTALHDYPSLGAQQRRQYPLDYSPFVPPTVDALELLAKAEKVRTGEVVLR